MKDRKQRPRVFLAIAVAPDALARIEAECSVQRFEGAGLPSKPELLAALDAVDGLLSSAMLPIDAEILAAAPRLRVISNFGVGFDNVDLEAATRQGVIVCNTPGVLVAAVADLTIALILSLARRLPESERFVRDGRWAPGASMALGTDLAGKTLGVVGLGRIGRAVALRAQAFGMEVCFHDRFREPAKDVAFCLYRDLDELLRESDFVTLHVNLVDETRGLIGAHELALMPASAYLINTARGQVVDQAALIDALRERRIAGAAVAVAYAAQRPERLSRLVLWAPYPRGADIVSRGQAQSLIHLVRQNWSLARRAIADITYPSGPTEFQRWLAGVMRQSISPEMAAKYLEFTATVDVTALLPQVKAPTLVLHRRGDRSVPSRAGRDVASLIPDARFVALDGDIAAASHGDTSYLETARAFLDEGRTMQGPLDAPTQVDVHTILFTDMEGSTALRQRLGDAKAQELVHAHDSIVREALQAHSGREIKHTGDGIMASFGSASQALDAAVAIQQAVAALRQAQGGHAEPVEASLRVYIGMNAGDPIAEEGDLFGTSVDLAKRICDQCQPGEILASEVVRQLVAGKDYLFADRGDTALRGFEDPVRLYELRWREA